MAQGKQEEANKNPCYDFYRATTFYVSNIPVGISNHNLWISFQEFGEIVDAFVARKKDKSGNHFGFVRFGYVKNVAGLLQSMQGVKCDKAILGVFLAKFDRNGNAIQQPDNHPSPHPHRHPNLTKTYQKSHQPQPSKPPPPPSFSDPRHCSFIDAVKGKPSDDVLRLSLPSRDFNPSDWADRAFVAKAKSLGFLNEVPKILALALKDSRYDLAYLGGLSILITLPTPQLADQFLKYYRMGLDEWFSSFGIMRSSEAIMERIAVLRIFGLPFSLWHKQVSNQIGSLFGQVLEDSTATSHDHNLSFDKITVLTGHKRIVNKSVLLRWKSRDIQVTIHEEETDWAPAFFSSSDSENGYTNSGDPPSPMHVESTPLGNTVVPSPHAPLENTNAPLTHTLTNAPPLNVPFTFSHTTFPSPHANPSHTKKPDFFVPSSPTNSNPTHLENRPVLPQPQTNLFPANFAIGPNTNVGNKSRKRARFTSPTKVSISTVSPPDIVFPSPLPPPVLPTPSPELSTIVPETQPSLSSTPPPPTPPRHP